MPCCRTHLPNTGCQLICTCPGRFNILAHSLSSTLHVAEVEVILTCITVSIDVPAWDCHVNLGRFRDLHMFREALHAFSKVLRPLANNVISDDDVEECYANQCGKHNKINATVPDPVMVSDWTREISGGTYFSPFFRSPALFLCIRQCLEQITKTAPDTAYPVVDRVLAWMRPSCWDSQVLICQKSNEW